MAIEGLGPVAPPPWENSMHPIRLALVAALVLPLMGCAVGPTVVAAVAGVLVAERHGKA